MPPSRRPVYTHVSADTAVTISDVYRGLQIIGTSVGQLTLDQRRGGSPLPAASVHPLVRRPQLDLAASHFWEETAMNLGTCGNAYWRKVRDPLGQVVELRNLNPAEVHVRLDQDVPVYSFRGTDLAVEDVEHLKLFRRTGYPMGLGPIQAAQTEVRGALEARDYAATWMSTTDIPTGVLTTDQVITGPEAKAAAAMWRGDGEEVPLGHSVRVLGQGLRYAPLMLRPADVQFIETRQMNRTQLASLLGIPSSLLLAPIPQGSSQSYANVEQEWIAFNRFTLMAYLRPMEAAMSRILPAGSDARFNVDALLRTDTLTRYQAHALAVDVWATVNEVRALEGQAPIPGGDVLRARSAPATPALEDAA